MVAKLTFCLGLLIGVAGGFVALLGVQQLLVHGDASQKSLMQNAITAQAVQHTTTTRGIGTTATSLPQPVHCSTMDAVARSQVQPNYPNPFEHMVDDCALVSPGPAMTRSRLGPRIDRHQRVFRVNSLPRPEMENAEDFGTRTDVLLLGCRWARLGDVPLLPPPGEDCVMEPQNGSRLCETMSCRAGGPQCNFTALVLAPCSDPPASIKRVWGMTPFYVGVQHGSVRRALQRLERSPSNTFLAFWTAAASCHRVTLYGLNRGRTQFLNGEKAFVGRLLAGTGSAEWEATHLKSGCFKEATAYVQVVIGETGEASRTRTMTTTATPRPPRHRRWKVASTPGAESTQSEGSEEGAGGEEDDELLDEEVPAEGEGGAVDGEAPVNEEPEGSAPPAEGTAPAPVPAARGGQRPLGRGPSRQASGLMRCNLLESVQIPQRRGNPLRTLSEDCAIVSSSSSLIGVGLGPTIDQHHRIFRINRLVTKEFAGDFGSRTDILFMNCLEARTGLIRMLGRQDKDAVNCLHGGGDCKFSGVVLKSCFYGPGPNPRVSMAKKVWGKAPFYVGLQSPDVIGLMYRIRGYPMKVPTGGLLAFWLAVTSCRSVTLYGFAGNANADGHAAEGQHNLQQEHKFLRSLLARQPVTWKQRTEASECFDEALRNTRLRSVEGRTGTEQSSGAAAGGAVAAKTPPAAAAAAAAAAGSAGGGSGGSGGEAAQPLETEEGEKEEVTGEEQKEAPAPASGVDGGDAALPVGAGEEKEDEAEEKKEPKDDETAAVEEAVAESTAISEAADVASAKIGGKETVAEAGAPPDDEPLPSADAAGGVVARAAKGGGGGGQRASQGNDEGESPEVEQAEAADEAEADAAVGAAAT